MIQRVVRSALPLCAAAAILAPTAVAQEKVEARAETQQVRKVDDVTLKRGLLAQPTNTAAESRLLLEQMKSASHELTHVIQQNSGRGGDRAAVSHLKTMQRDLDEAIAAWEEKLSSIGEDAQLANIELQNMLQKQQQTLQTMSNVSKMAHDTAMAIIRKIG